MCAPAEKTTKQPKPGMADAKLQMVTVSGKWGWTFPFVFYILLYSLSFFFLYNKFYFDQKQRCYSQVQGFLLVFPRQGGWPGGHKKGWFTALEQVKGTEIGTGRPVSLRGLAWCRYHVYPECPRLLSTVQLIRLARLLSMPARLQAFLIHSRETGPPVATG